LIALVTAVRRRRRAERNNVGGSLDSRLSQLAALILAVPYFGCASPTLIFRRLQCAPPSLNLNVVKIEKTQTRDISRSDMINAVLVFNNNGQPRLTKFYTQLVRPPTTMVVYSPKAPGHQRPAATDIRDLHPRLQPAHFVM
jgi:hypothetical protein